MCLPQLQTISCFMLRVRWIYSVYSTSSVVAYINRWSYFVPSAAKGFSNFPISSLKTQLILLSFGSMRFRLLLQPILKKRINLGVGFDLVRRWNIFSMYTVYNLLRLRMTDSKHFAKSLNRYAYLKQHVKERKCKAFGANQSETQACKVTQGCINSASG